MIFLKLHIAVNVNSVEDSVAFLNVSRVKPLFKNLDPSLHIYGYDFVQLYCMDDYRIMKIANTSIYLHFTQKTSLNQKSHSGEHFCFDNRYGVDQLTK